MCTSLKELIIVIVYKLESLIIVIVNKLERQFLVQVYLASKDGTRIPSFGAKNINKNFHNFFWVKKKKNSFTIKE